jgi:hypothetical protein
MRKLLIVGLLSIRMGVQAEVAEAYGVIKPTSSLQGVGIVHLREKKGLEVEGYFSSSNEQRPLVFSLWETKTLNRSPLCIGAHSNECLGDSTVIPVQQILTLGQLVTNQEGYGELSVKHDDLSLKDINNTNMRILVYPKDEKVQALSNNLIEHHFSMIELRWIEN